MGLWLPPGSNYSHPEEKLYEVVVSDGVTTLLDASGNSADKVSFDLSANDAEISGSFKLSGQVVSGLVGEVHAIRVDGDGWQSSAIEDDGTLLFATVCRQLGFGLLYRIRFLDRNFPAHPAKPVVLQAIPSTSVEQDFLLSSASASISGTVRYDAIILRLLVLPYSSGLIEKGTNSATSTGMRLKPMRMELSRYLYFLAADTRLGQSCLRVFVNQATLTLNLSMPIYLREVSRTLT